MGFSNKKFNSLWFLSLLILGMSIALQAASNRPKPSSERLREGGFIDGTYPGNWNDTFRHEQNFEFLRKSPKISLKRDAYNADQGNISVIQDDGTIVFNPNPFDLDNSNIHFTPNPSGVSYQVSKVPKNFDPATGAIQVTDPGQNTLGDDSTRLVPFANSFRFTFFGQQYNSVYVASDGFLSFVSGDGTSDDRDIVRFLGRQPRIAPFFADLRSDLTGCTGTVSTLQKSDRFIVVWNDVSKFVDSCTSRDHDTFEVILFADGSIEFSYNGIQSPSAIVGIAPGSNQGSSSPMVDYTTLTSPTSESGAVYEVFVQTTQVSIVSLARKFYQTHGDDYDFLVMFTNFPFDMGNAFAFEVNVSNEVTGLGTLPVFGLDRTSFWGSSSRLRSFLTMGPLSQYPSDPNLIFLGTNSTLEVMGQEFGHRWMAFDDIPNATCDPTTTPQKFINSILGRDCAHWSYFFNSHGSVMEGNDIVDDGGGNFHLTANATTIYSDLDQYFMGLRDASEVQPTFVVFNPQGTRRKNGSAPEASGSFSGTRHDVPINDIITRNGLRTPTAANSPHTFRQGWILLVQKGTTPSKDDRVLGDISQIDTIRQAWQSFFSAATSVRGTVNTTLVPSVFSATLTPNNGVSKVSSGQGALSVSYGQLNSTTTTPPVALAIFALTQNGALVTEAGVPAATPTQAAQFFVDYDASSGKDSGVALVNPNNGAITINASLQSQIGQSSPCTAIQIPGLGHVARFASQLGCTGLVSPFLGTIKLTSNQPFAAVNLRAANNAHGELIFSTLPVADPTVTPTGTNLTFPQVIDGGGNPTQILLMNTSGSTITGVVALFDDNGNPIQLDFGSGLVSSFSYSIAANGMQKYSTTGIGSLKVGYAVVTPTTGVLPSGALIFGQNNATGGLASQAGVLNAVPTTSARVYIERSSAPLVRDTGVALVNRNSAAATVTLIVTSLDGSFNQTTTITVPSNGHVAKFIEQFISSVPVDFQGVLWLQSNLPIAPVTLRLTTNQRAEQLFSTLPVANLNSPPTGAQYLAQVVNGGGYVTQIILINTTSGGGTVGIVFINDNGTTVFVPFS